MKKLLFSIMLFVLIIPLMATSCLPVADVPESPFSAKYVVEQWLEQGQRIFTTNILPRVDDNCIRITNYWWREYDEEGNVEWLRLDEDYYCVVLPISDSTITIRKIKAGQIIKTVHMYEGE